MGVGLFVLGSYSVHSLGLALQIIDRPSLETTLVPIHLGTVEYAIPRNDLTSVTIHRDGGEAGLQLVLRFPAFQGAMTKRDLHDFRDYNLWSSPELLSIRGPALLIQSTQGLIDYAKASGIIGAGERSVEWSKPQGRYAVEPAHAGEEAFSVSCVRLSHVRCTDFISLPGGYVVFCQYDETLLPDRRLIHQGVLKLFASFRSDDGAAIGSGSH